MTSVTPNDLRRLAELLRLTVDTAVAVASALGGPHAVRIIQSLKEIELEANVVYETAAKIADEQRAVHDLLH